MSFPFPLLSDPNASIASLLDVKRPRGHPLASIPRRVTYLIDPDGVIRRAYDVGRHIEGHAGDVLGDLEELAGADS
jgi:peroxiredoxin